MDRPEVKHRVAISYIVVAICLIAIFVLQFWLAKRSIQNTTPAEADSTVSGETSDVAAQPDPEEETTDDDAYAVLDAEYCIQGDYRYRMVSDAEELAALGLPEAVTEDILGGNLATANDKIALYAYPAYGCRAVLIASKNDAYSFCVLDGFTSDAAAQTLDVIFPLYGLNTVSDIASAQIAGTDGTVRQLTGENVQQFYDLLSGCENAGEKAAVTAGQTIAFTSQRDAVCELTYYSDVSLICVLGEYYTVTDELKTLIAGILA